MNLVRFSWGVIKEAGLYIRKSTGRALREAGLELDRKGSIMERDIACL